MNRDTCDVIIPSSAATALTVRGELVTQLKFDFGFTIVTESSDTRIATAFRLNGPEGQTHTIDPEKPSHADELLELHQTSVDGDYFDDGSLELRFSNGFTLNVAPDNHVEAWTLTRGNGEMIVATPGGGITTFGPRP